MGMVRAVRKTSVHNFVREIIAVLRIGVSVGLSIGQNLDLVRSCFGPIEQRIELLRGA
jgi:hypothetical protein